jgi:hypothetical protein
MRLTLTLPASSTEWPIEPESLEVRGPTGAVTVPLRSAVAGVLIPIPADSAADDYVISLTRRLGAPVIATTQLMAQRPGERALDVLWRPFAPAVSPAAIRFVPPSMMGAVVDPGTCLVDGPSPPPCGDVAIALSPNEGGGPFGGFQSARGTGIMTPVTVTFSQPVGTVRVTALDPTWAGNTATAFGAGGETLSTQAFPHTGVPGVFSEPSVVFTGAISRLLLTPAPLEYIAYRLEVTVSAASGISLSLVPGGSGLIAPSYQRFQSNVCSISAVSSSRTYQVRVLRSNPASDDSVSNRQVSLALTPVRLSGSHAHDNASRPTGSFAPNSQVSTKTVVSDASGAAQFEFFAPEPSGLYVITASAAGAASVSDTVSVGYALTPMPPNVNYVFVGETDVHPENHHATATMAAAVRELADSLKLFSGSVLALNDQSLPSGGLFDLNEDWSVPHCSHRRGIDVDIRDRVLSAAESRYIKLVWPQTSGGARWLQERDHIHLTGRR